MFSGTNVWFNGINDMSGGSDRILFIGVGGMGMAPLACWMAQSGQIVYGVDDHLRQSIRSQLIDAGVELRDFVLAEQLSFFTLVVYSSAIQSDHPILLAAGQQGVPTCRRGEMLAQVTQGKKLIAIVGSHGKTTTSGMIAHMLQVYDMAANYIVGGLFNDSKLPYKYSESEWFVAEVDESDGTIDHFKPEVTVVLNLDWDHADRYSSWDELAATFHQLIERTQAKVLIPAGYGISQHFNSIDTQKIVRYSTDVAFESTYASGFNQANAAAALAALNVMQAACADVSGLDHFAGMARRQSPLLQAGQLTVIEDYAHHPTEIHSLLSYLRHSNPGKRLIAVFQPHRYTRTKQFKIEFAASLQLADEVFLLPVYAAFEPELAGGRLIELSQSFSGVAPHCLELNLTGASQLFDSLDPTQPQLVVFIGAGNIDGFAALFTAWIQSEQNSQVAWLKLLQSRTSSDCKLKLDEPLANKTTLRVGGNARYYSEPSNLTDLRALLLSAKLFGIQTFCLGRGSNLLVSDQGYDGLVIRFSAADWRRVESLSEQRIWVGAGARLKEVCALAARNGMAGFEFLEGIPGALGGALRMNAGAMGSWMFDVVESVQFIDSDGRFQHWSKEDFHFGYRKVEEISRGIAVAAILRAAQTDCETDIRQRMDSYSSSRKESQPRAPSAGCIFKNPAGNFAGKLIDQYQLKGLRVGQAEVSGVHGNFIINQGGATSAEVIALIQKIQNIIKLKSGYELEPEVLLLGESWDLALRAESGC
jgi:UDP-N-acetylmuramate--alanine ligase